ncbi:predicted protein [Nematostella vectensis]|uniref:Gem-associated protein 2 n=1 Tax=Nematostella vectensis TaxID=45351 RepID=A7SU44_NEMVE|nr:gem-associated protein 2 [Nematostella vectensis]EDO32758.1 predicted protein [Nematostella vectensis]|eukprot:XP_001624858.1 predicted protein [Nematostella vectensis]
MEPVLGFLEESDEYFEEYDETKLPTTGLEYLRRVQQEAERCPEVVIADLTNKEFGKKQTVKINQDSGCAPAPTGAAPSLEWQQQQAADFADVRQCLANYKTKANSLTDANISWPSKNDEIQWCRFCLGREAAIHICKAFGYPDSRLTHPQQMPEMDNFTEQQWENGSPPTLTMMVKLNQTLVQRLLEWHTLWMSVLGYSHDQGRWIYSLLVCLEKPLLADCTATLRTLARQCTECRLTQMPMNEKNVELVTSLNLIIALVSRYFGQTDLADPG